MAPYGLTYARVPDPVNFFMNVHVGADGTLSIAEPLSAAGDYVRLNATMDLIVAVSACPQDMNETNGFAPTDVALRVSPSEAVAGEDDQGGFARHGRGRRSHAGSISIALGILIDGWTLALCAG